MANPPKGYVTTSEASTLSGVPTGTIRAWIVTRKIKYKRFGPCRDYCVRLADVQAMPRRSSGRPAGTPQSAETRAKISASRKGVASGSRARISPKARQSGEDYDRDSRG